MTKQIKEINGWEYQSTNKAGQFRTVKKEKKFLGYYGPHPKYTFEKYFWRFLAEEITVDQAKEFLLSTTINFGKHKGKLIKDTPVDYLKWITSQASTNKETYEPKKYFALMLKTSMELYTLPSIAEYEEAERIKNNEKLKQQKKAKLAAVRKVAQESKGLPKEFTILRNTKQVMDAKYTGMSKSGKYTFRIDNNTLLYIRDVKAIQAIELIEDAIYKLEGKIQIFTSSYEKIRRGGLVGLKVL